MDASDHAVVAPPELAPDVPSLKSLSEDVSVSKESPVASSKDKCDEPVDEKKGAAIEIAADGAQALNEIETGAGDSDNQKEPSSNPDSLSPDRVSNQFVARHDANIGEKVDITPQRAALYKDTGEEEIHEPPELVSDTVQREPDIVRQTRQASVGQSSHDPRKSLSVVVVELSAARAVQTPLSMSKFSLQSGYYGMQGRRPTMEDFHAQIQHPEFNNLVPAVDLDGRQRHFFAIYDGHGGPWCAEYCSRTLHQNLIRNPLFKDDSKKALHDAVVETDDTFCALIRDKGLSESSGTTAIVAYIVDDLLLVANVGDSRAVMCRAGTAVSLSQDHKPNRKDERARILEMGGFVGRTLSQARAEAGPGGIIWSNMCNCACLQAAGPGIPPYRVYPGGLAISRSIGDLEMKATRLVVNTPEIAEVPLTDADEFVILACDGVWDVLSNDEAVKHVRAFRKRMGEHPMEAAKHLATLAFSEGSTDNISVLVIFLGKHDAPMNPTP